VRIGLLAPLGGGWVRGKGCRALKLRSDEFVQCIAGRGHFHPLLHEVEHFGPVGLRQRDELVGACP